MKGIMSRILLVSLIFVFIINSKVFAGENNSFFSKFGNAQIKSVTQWSFFFSPKDVKRNEYTQAWGEAWTTCFGVPADAKFEMLLDGYCDQPAIVARTNLPYKNIIKRNRSEFGGECWEYNSGVLWYNQNTYYSLKMKAKSSQFGVHKGMWGSSYYIPDHWENDTFTVRK